MEKKMDFYKERGLVRCLLDGCGLFAANRRLLSKGLLLPALGRALGGAFAVAAFTFYAGGHLLPAWRMAQSGVPVAVAKAALAPSVAEAALLFLAVSLPLCLHYIYIGVLNAQVAECAASGEVGSRWLPRGFRREVLRRGGRALAVDAVFFLLVAAGCLAAGWGARRWDGVWPLAILLPVCLCLFHAQGVSRCLSAFAGKGFFPSLRLGAWRLWLPLLPLRLLCGIPAAVFSAIALLPVAVFVGTALTAFDSALLGDGFHLSAGVCWLCGLVNAVCFFLSSLARAFAYWPFCLGVGNAARK